MRFTLTQAAKEASVSKGTISKALKSGRLSGERQEDGSFQIEPVELFRVFPRKPQEPSGPRAGTAGKPMETVADRPETPAASVVELAELRVETRLLREMVDDLRARLDRTEEERRALALRLMPPSAPERPQERPDAAPVVQEPAKASRGFLGRLWRR